MKKNENKKMHVKSKIIKKKLIKPKLKYSRDEITKRNIFLFKKFSGEKF